MQLRLSLRRTDLCCHCGTACAIAVTKRFQAISDACQHIRRQQVAREWKGFSGDRCPLLKGLVIHFAPPRSKTGRFLEATGSNHLQGLPIILGVHGPRISCLKGNPSSTCTDSSSHRSKTAESGHQSPQALLPETEGAVQAQQLWSLRQLEAVVSNGVRVVDTGCGCGRLSDSPPERTHSSSRRCLKTEEWRSQQEPPALFLARTPERHGGNSRGLEGTGWWYAS